MRKLLPAPQDEYPIYPYPINEWVITWTDKEGIEHCQKVKAGDVIKYNGNTVVIPDCPQSHATTPSRP